VVSRVGPGARTDEPVMNLEVTVPRVGTLAVLMIRGGVLVGRTRDQPAVIPAHGEVTWDRDPNRRRSCQAASLLALVGTRGKALSDRCFGRVHDQQGPIGQQTHWSGGWLAL